MFNTITTNEWTRAEDKKPFINRPVLVHFDDDTFGIARWNGYYWVGQHNMRLMRNVEVTHWYMFDKFNDDEE